MVRSGLTTKISDPAHPILDCQPEPNRRVQCIWLGGQHTRDFRPIKNENGRQTTKAIPMPTAHPHQPL